MLEHLHLFEDSPPEVIECIRGQLIPDVALEGEEIVRYEPDPEGNCATTQLWLWIANAHIAS